MKKTTDVITPYGDTWFMKTSESLLRSVRKLTFKKPTRIHVTYMAGSGREELAALKWSDRIQLTWVPF